MPSKAKDPTKAESLLLKPVEGWLTHLVGIAAALLGAALLAAACILLHAMLSRQFATLHFIYAVPVVIALIAAFLLNAGVRILLSMPNKDGSLFPPSVWFMVSAAMLCLAGAIASTMRTTNFADVAQALVSALLLALLAYGTGAHFRAKAKVRRAA